MNIFDKEVIFSKTFPEVEIGTLETNKDNLPEIKQHQERPVPPFEELWDELLEKYDSIPRYDPDEKSKEFISCAIELCEDFEINTEIAKVVYGVSVSMDIGFGWFGGSVKKELESLIALADDISFFFTERQFKFSYYCDVLLL